MSQNSIGIKYLNRYTSLPFLLDILHNKALTLVDPKSWEDTNDSYFMELYKKKSGKESVLTLCFAQYLSNNKAAEKYHHWKIYSGNSSGVCIQFNKEELVKHFKYILGNSLRCDRVRYKTINSIEKDLDMQRVNLRDLPFIKRSAFNDEREYRFIYESNEKIASKDVPITLNFISRITFNPWILVSAYESVCEVIREIEEGSNIDLKRSTCLDNERWKKAGEKIANMSD